MLGDGGHCLSKCPHFLEVGLRHACLFDGAHGNMLALKRHKDQKSVAFLDLAIVVEMSQSSSAGCMEILTSLPYHEA